MGFQLDTSGRVTIPPKDQWELASADTYGWSDLSPFTQGYVEEMFASLHAAGTTRPVLAGNAPTSSVIAHMPLGFSDLAPETLARIMEDCSSVNYLRGRAIMGMRPGRSGGEQFWIKRQAGEFAHYRPLTPYLGDDGKVYLRAGDQ